MEIWIQSFARVSFNFFLFLFRPGKRRKMKRKTKNYFWWYGSWMRHGARKLYREPKKRGWGCIELVHIIEFECNPIKIKRKVQKKEKRKKGLKKCVLLPPPWLKIWDNHRWIIISDDTKWYSTWIFSPQEIGGGSKNEFKGTTHTQVTILYVFLDRVWSSFFNQLYFLAANKLGKKNVQSLSTAGPHTKNTLAHRRETPPKQPTPNEEKSSFFFFLILFFFSFLIWGIFLIKFLNRQTTGRADDSGTTDRLCSSFFRPENPTERDWGGKKWCSSLSLSLSSMRSSSRSLRTRTRIAKRKDKRRERDTRLRHRRTLRPNKTPTRAKRGKRKKGSKLSILFHGNNQLRAKKGKYNK